MGESSDEDLLKNYQRTKDKRWITKLFGRYVEMVYGVCLRYTPDAREAEDMTMEVYEKIVDKAKTHSINKFRSWLYVVSKYHCLEHIRKMTGQKTESFDPSFMQFGESIHPFEEAEERAMSEQQYQLLMDCISSLNFLQRRSIELFYYQNKTYREIAKVLENKESQIRSHLQNGRRNIRNCFERKNR